MDELYSDLENFRHEDILDELRNENKELKHKLEENTSTLSDLQREFDKLSAEYKKLELNYSSLLKTARAEIERKTQMITNLNLEKDQLVINLLQNRGRTRYNNTNKNQNKENTEQAGLQLVKEAESVKENKYDNSLPNPVEKNNCSTVNKNESSRKDKLQSDPRTGPLGSGKQTGDVREKEQTSKSIDHNIEGDKNRIDNKKNQEIPKDEYSIQPSKLRKIRDRRKSMPLFNRGDFQFSSDEEQDHLNHQRFRRKSPPIRDAFDRVHYDKDCSRRNVLDRKSTDFSREEYKRSHYESHWDNYSKSNRYPDSDKHKYNDNSYKYDSFKRSRRPYTPESFRHNTYREEDSSHRSDYNRRRVLESPPPVNLNQRQRSRESDKRSIWNNEEHFPTKHKLHDVTDVPVSKRMRTKSFSRHQDNYLNFQLERDFGGHAPTIYKPEELSHLSLQSPDYLENIQQAQHIKEIMGTAATKLDDPRLISKKYIVNTKEDKVELSTVVGRDVHIKCVDTTNWDLNKEIINMPTPLKEKPQIIDDLAKEIYVNIDDPINLNNSFESGEINLQDDIGNTFNKNVDKPSSITVTEDTKEFKKHDQIEVTKKHTDDDKSIQGCSTLFSNIPKIKESYVNIANPVSNISLESGEIGSDDELQTQGKNQDNKTNTAYDEPGTCSTLLSKSYKVPKNKIPKITKSKAPNESESVEIPSERKADKKVKYAHKKNNDKEKRYSERKSRRQSDRHSVSIEVCKDEPKHRIKTQRKKRSPEKVKISARDTVAGDLELSDETSDFTEVCEQTRCNEIKNVEEEGNEKKNIKSGSKELKSTEQDNFKGSQSNSKRGTELTERSFGCKKFIATPSDDLLQPSVKRSKEDMSKDIKSQLCDLFGDSSSLITSEDLGIVETSALKKHSNDFALIFDTTQDAVDLNIEEMENLQSRSLKLKTDESNIVNESIDVKSEKIHKGKMKKSSDDGENKVQKNVEETPPIVSLKTVNAQNEKANEVKTVIISSGIQNNCHSEVINDQGQEKLVSITEHNVFNKEPSCQSLPSLKALATSTPHKVQLSVTVPDVSCSSKKSVTSKDTSKISLSAIDEENVDVPDVRIIVKRRRKTKGTSC